MIDDVCELRDRETLANLFRAGTAGSTPPRPRGPWHWAHPNWTNVCAPAATCGDTLADVCAASLGPVAWIATVFVRSP